MGSWWAYGAVTRDTRGGRIARRAGASLAELIRDIQEKYNQAIIFYRTGKLAMASAKTWDKYDERFKIKESVNQLKKMTRERVIQFNTAFEEYSFTDQARDLWNVIVATPKQAQFLDKKLRFTSSIAAFGTGLFYSVRDEVTLKRNEF